MQILSLKELESVLKLCRKHGVRNIEIDGIKMQLEDVSAPVSQSGKDSIETAPELTDEQLAVWSSNG